MNGQLRLNVVLPIVLFAVLAVAVGLFTLSRGPASSGAAETVRPLSALPRPTHTRTPPAQTAKPRTGTRPAKPKPAKPVVKLNDGLPPALARALTARSVAVVSLVTPSAGLDEMAAKEAAAGARAAGASFVTVDVSRERDARPLAVMLGTLEAPSVLVFKRPGELVVRLNGFADLDTVAQAADNAAS
jgi:hypothetical protein